MFKRTLTAGLLLLLPLLVAVAWAAPPDIDPVDAKVLREAGLSADAPAALLGFFRTRTLAEADRAEIQRLVDQLGDDEFAIRDRASTLLEQHGASAVSLLRQALHKDDIEVVRRAEACLEHIEKVAGPAVSTAAARVLARRKPPGTAETLLAYLPFADDEAVADEVRATLAAVALVEGRRDPALQAALKDSLPLKRAAAAEALIRGGNEAIRHDQRGMMADADPRVRWRVAAALHRFNDLEAVPVLIDLIAELPEPADARQVESLLLDLAGELGPRVTLNDDPDARKPSRDAWKTWWKTYDGPGLLAYFRRQTPPDDELARLVGLVRQLGDDSAQVRLKAQADLEAAGPMAIPLLRRATRQAKSEPARLAQKTLDQIKARDLPGAVADAARLLAVRRPPGADAALLAFLPVADEDAVEDIWNALASLAVPDGRPDPILVAALDDRSAARRAGAAVALARAGVASARPAIRKLLEDSDPNVRLPVALTLARSGVREAVPVLIELVLQLPPEQVWQVESLLQRLAEEKALPALLTADEPSRKKCRDAWAAWWKDHGAKADLARLEAGNRLLGYTLLVYTGNIRGGGGRMAANGQIVEIGSSGKPHWQFDGLQYPMDAQVVAANRVLVAEYSGNQVTERNFKGEVLWTKQIPMPINCQRLANGNTFIACRNQLVEVDRTGREINLVSRTGHDVMAAQRLRNGQTMLLTTAGQLTRLDGTGKEISSIGVAVQQRFGMNFDILPNGHVVVPLWNANKIVEYDAQGKRVWEATASRPTSVVRLPNGNTLTASLYSQQITELDRTGKEIWQFSGDAQVMRARRR